MSFRRSTVLLVLLLLAACSPSPAPSFEELEVNRVVQELLLSTKADRSGAKPLDAARVSGDIYVFTPARPGWRSVDFYLNGSPGKAQPHSRASYAPFDLVEGGKGAPPKAFDTAELEDGVHTLSAEVARADGQKRVFTATFLVDNSGAWSGVPLVSTSAQRTEAQPLQGATLSGAAASKAYIFVVPDKAVDSIDFYMDNSAASGEPLQTERIPFYDAGSTAQDGSARAVDISGLSNGKHSLTTVTKSAAGSKKATTTFTVERGATPPTDPKAQAWSDPATWGGSVPQDGATVDIPAGKTVVLDVDSAELRGLRIEGTLRFADKDLALSADWIMVQGRLQIGRADKPYTHRALITLTGNNPNAKTPVSAGIGNKVLGVVGGTLEVHGQERVSWTQLGATAPKGATSVRLKQAPDWRVGERIVIASTDYDFNQAEERTITAISGATVSFAEPLQYMHYGQMQSFGGKTFDQRAEVGLLSRNITVRGGEAGSAEGFGGHIIVREGSTARVSGTELTNMGQARNDAKNFDGQGRYPFHWHLAGDSARGSYLQDSSIHASFNRCVTIHGSNGVVLKNNVAYDTVGHCYFLEDGNEVDNVLEGNLGLGARRPEANKALLPSDRDFAGPAVFWVTNPDNVLRRNVAAGSQGSGFWYALPEHPTGPSATDQIWPRRTPLGGFIGNVAHSNLHTGLMVDRGPASDPQRGVETTSYRPVKNPQDRKSEAVVAEFETFSAYKNSTRGVWLRGKNHVVSGARLADNAIGVTFASDESFAVDSVFVGESANKGTPEPWMIDQGKVGRDGRSLPRPWEPEFAIRGFEFYDGLVGTRSSYFTRFEPNAQRQAAALSYLDFTDFAVNAGNFAQKASFDAKTNRVYLATRATPAADKRGEDGYRSSVFIDEDGSVTGRAGSAVVVNNPFMLEACSYRKPWNAWVCQDRYASLWLENEDVAPNKLGAVTLVRADGKKHTMLGRPEDGGAATNFGSILRLNDSYRYELSSLPGHSRVRLQNVAVGDSLRVAVPYSAGQVYLYRDYWVDARNLATRVGSLEELNRSSGDSYYLAGGTLHLKLTVQDGKNYASFDVCRRANCAN